MPSDSADESLESISMIDAYRGVETEYNRVLVDTILSISKETQIDFSVKEVFNDDFSQNGALGSCKDDNFSESDPWRESLGLKPETVAWVALGKTTVVKFFPSSSTWMIAAGNKFGDISFWNIDCETEDGVYVYRTHSDPISGILIQQNSLSKIYSCGLDRFVRLMDAEKEVFDLVHSCDDAIHYLSQQPSDLASLYFAGGDGGLKVLDTRTGKSSRNWILHKDKINTISFNSHNSNIMATGSTDGTACIWDLRSRSSRRHETLKTLSQGEAVHSAYFSPSGSSLATIREASMSYLRHEADLLRLYRVQKGPGDGKVSAHQIDIRYTTVADLIDEPNCSWKEDVISNLFGADQARAICSIPLSPSFTTDRQIWRGDNTGFLIRDSEEQVLAAGSQLNSNILDPATTEAISALQALKFAADLGFHKIVLGGDSLTVIKKLKHPVEDISLLAAVISEAKTRLGNFHVSYCSFVLRMENQAAHAMAKEGWNVASPSFWIEEVPHTVARIVEYDIHIASVPQQ
ncbi:hypothetical protein V6N12_052343 [Hibiscus sabdariffa]|uniref:RNase H type-1 domain-containing protein n=1 Tax=Hibiscus sabdariffa TaxID=183260 RepID=A0ABR2GIZ3_9ROSI